MLYKLIMEIIHGKKEIDAVIPIIIEEDVLTVSDFRIELEFLNISTDLNKKTSMRTPIMFRVEDVVYIASLPKSDSIYRFSYSLDEFLANNTLLVEQADKIKAMAKDLLSREDHSFEYMYKVLKGIDSFHSKHYIGVGSQKFNEYIIEKVLSEKYQTKTLEIINIAKNNIVDKKIDDTIKYAKVSHILDEQVYDKFQTEMNLCEPKHVVSFDFVNIVESTAKLMIFLKYKKEAKFKLNDEITISTPKDNYYGLKDYQNRVDVSSKFIGKTNFNYDYTDTIEIEKTTRAILRSYFMEIEYGMVNAKSLNSPTFTIIKCDLGCYLTDNVLNNYKYDFYDIRLGKQISEELYELILKELFNG